MATVVERPRLPDYLRAPPDALGLVFCLYSLLLFVVPAALSIAVFQIVEPLWLKLVLLVPLWLVAEHGIHMLGMVGHEGFHGNLHRNRAVSIQLGLIFSSMAISYLVTGYYVSHWHHHLYTNTDDDPDVQACSRFKTVWVAVLSKPDVPDEDLSQEYLSVGIRGASSRAIVCRLVSTSFGPMPNST